MRETIQDLKGNVVDEIPSREGVGKQEDRINFITKKMVSGSPFTPDEALEVVSWNMKKELKNSVHIQINGVVNHGPGNIDYMPTQGEIDSVQKTEGIIRLGTSSEEPFPITHPTAEDLKRFYAADGERLMRKSDEEEADWVTSDMKDRSSAESYEGEEEHKAPKDLLKKVQALPAGEGFPEFLDRTAGVSNVDLLKYLWQTAQTARNIINAPTHHPSRSIHRLLLAMQLRIENHTGYHDARMEIADGKESATPNSSLSFEAESYDSPGEARQEESRGNERMHDSET